ncbi:MAG: hypothetical protein DKT66_19385 [Candidatus Melainabacteria bacterium]|nr:MAG: hypothetical protein DKT66_19385 [Candidatus Melainabacteria bacterium]
MIARCQNNIQAKRILTLALSALLLLTSCGGSKQVRFSSPFKEDDELTANLAFKIVEKSYQIKPDRRYLMALSNVSQIVIGKPLEKVDAVFENGLWHIKSDKKDITTIKDFPSFLDMSSSLSKYARSLEGEQGQHRFESNGKNILNHSKVFGGFETELDLVREEKNPNWTKGEPPRLEIAEKVATKVPPKVSETKAARATDNVGQNAPNAPVKTPDAAETKKSTNTTQQPEAAPFDAPPKQQDPIDQLLLEYSPRSSFKALELINAQWEEDGGSPQLIDQAATALTGLAFQTYDRAGTADDLFAQALAFASLSARYETQNAKRNQVRLAEAMGYRLDAKNLAAALPEEDPLRMYIMWQAQTVGAAVEQGLNSNESKFLYVKKLANAENLLRLREYCKNRFDKNSPLSLSVYGCLQPLRASDQLTPETWLFENVFFSELKALTGKSIDSHDRFFPHMDKYLKDADSRQKDNLISSAVVTSFLRAFAYSYVLDYLQPDNGFYTEKAAEKIFDEKFGMPRASEVGESICALAHSILDARTGNYHVAKLLGNAVGPKDLGDFPRFLAFDEAARWFANGEPKLISAGKTIFENIDSRPENRFRAASIAHNELLHPLLALNLNKLALDADADGMLSVAAAKQNADQMHLRRIADNKIGVPSRRARAMAALFDFTGHSDRGAKNLYVDRIEELVEHTPGNIEILRQYVHTSILAGDTAVAIENTKKWIEKSGDYPKQVKLANQLLAALYYSNGNPDETLKLLDGHIDNKVDVHVAETYVNALTQKGREPKAEAYADAYYVSNRLSPAALALKTQIFWKKHAYNEAALVLKGYPWFLKAEIWRREIYPAFKRTLAGFPEESKSAVRALAKEGFSESTNIGELAQSFSLNGSNDTSFNILNAVLTSSFSGHELNYLNLSTLAYTYLEATENPQIALKWIQENVPPQFFTPLAMFAFQNGAYDLLWKLIPESPQGVGSEYVWLTRAAAMPMQKGINKDANRLLIQHYAQDDSDALFQIGKCLIGAVDSKTMIDKRINVRELCDLSYFLGSREAYLGDQMEAAKWYHMALETGMNKASESARNAEAIRRLTLFYPDWSSKP